MKAFITGIGGFVGAYLTRYLLSQGFSVSGFDREKKELEGAKCYAADILDYDSLLAIIKKEKPDYVFHLAGQSSVDKSFQIPELTRQINVDGTENLLKAILAAKLTPRILIVSSAEVYGTPEELPITEKHPVQAISPYAESRLLQEALCLRYAQEKGMFIVISRSFNHTGPGQPLPFVCPTIAKQAAEIKKGSRRAVELGNPDIQRDFSDVRDIARAYALALQKGKSGETYNICSGSSYSLRKLVGMLGKKLHITIEVHTNPEQTREKDIPLLVGDNAKFCSQTGWEPEIPIEQTLQEMAAEWEKKV